MEEKRQRVVTEFEERGILIFLKKLFASQCTSPAYIIPAALISEAAKQRMLL